MKKHVILLLLTLCLLPFVSVAATVNTGDTGIGATGQSVGHAGEKWAKNLEYVALAVGLGLAIFGLVQLVKARDGRSSAGTGAAMLIGGIALTSIVALLGTGSETLFGTDETETILQTLQHN